MKKLLLGLTSILSVLGFSETTDTEEKTVTFETYNINITNEQEDKGYEIGEDSYAKGNNSISTVNKGIAIGNNARALGSGQAEIVDETLKRYEDGLREIKLTKKEINNITDELTEIQIRHRETIEAAIRVEEVRKAKEKARLIKEEKYSEWKTLERDSEEFFRVYNQKLEDINSRLSGLSRLDVYNIEDTEQLNQLAKKFKEQVEQGTSLNLTEEFYKDYIVSYYKALGDLRKNEIRLSKSYDVEYYPGDYSNASMNGVKGAFMWLNNLDEIDAIPSFAWDNKHVYFYLTNEARPILNTVEGFEYIQTQPEKNMRFFNVNTEIATEEQYEQNKQMQEKFKKMYEEYVDGMNNPYFDEEMKTNFKEALKKKVDQIVLSSEIAYYQGEYEKTKNYTWLDKKKVALDKYNGIIKEFNENKKYKISNQLEKAIEKWKKENITDIMERNKITTDKLTEELEREFGISKAQIKAREDEIASKKKAYENANANYENINPSERDLMLSREYEALSKKLKEKMNNYKLN